MTRIAGLLAILSCPSAWAQFMSIAATDDARQIYFTTPLVEPTAPDGPLEHRVFRLDSDGVRLFSERGGLAFESGGSTGDGVLTVQVSGDGRSVAFVRRGLCLSADRCMSPTTRAEIIGRYARTFAEANDILLSRNGRWAWVIPPQFSGMIRPGEPGSENTKATLVDLESGTSIETDRPGTADQTFALASDGSALVNRVGSDNRRLPGIWRNGQFQPLPRTPGLLMFLAMSDDASTVLVGRIELTPGQPPPLMPRQQLMALDVRTGAYRPLGATDETGRWVPLGMSNDGSRALLSVLGPNGPGAAYIADVRNAALHRVPLPAGERTVAGALTGDGTIAILGTTSGRIVRVAVRNDGRPAEPVEELLPATPYSEELTQVTAPGLRMTIAAPLPGDIDWRGRIRIGGFPAAILASTGGRLDVQIPWELPPGMHDFTIDYPTASPLVVRAKRIVSPFRPSFPEMAEGARGLLGGRLIKGDFSGYVTEPLRQGDVVHMYFTGLGQVSGSVETGKPTPSDGLRPVLEPLRCRFLPGNGPEMETLFAGLAPGLIGIYQVTFRIPEGSPPTPSGLHCGSFGFFTPAMQ